MGSPPERGNDRLDRPAEAEGEELVRLVEDEAGDAAEGGRLAVPARQQVVEPARRADEYAGAE